MLSELPENISTFGGDIDNVLAIIWWITIAWLVAAEAVLLYLVVKYRAKDGVRASWLPASARQVAIWIMLPAALVTVFDVYIEVCSASVWHTVKEEVPAHDQLVRIEGRQFAWTFTYAGEDGLLDTEDDFTTINELFNLIHAIKIPPLNSIYFTNISFKL